MARLLALCSLPRSNPGDQLQYVRRNGPFTLYMTATGREKRPYGNLPRMLLAWVCTEAVRTQSRELMLGDSLSEFMRKVGIYSTGGGVHLGSSNAGMGRRLMYRARGLKALPVLACSSHHARLLVPHGAQK